MVCAYILVGLVVCRGNFFHFNAHMFCVDGADEAVP